MKNPRLTAWLLVLGSVIVGLVIGFAVGQAVTESETVAPTVTVPVGADVSPNDPTLTLDLDNEYGQSNVERTEEPLSEEDPTVHEDLRDETPPGVDQEDVDNIAESDPQGLGEPQPIGGAQNYSCPLRLVRNFSERASGTHVGLAPVIHYTVSLPGSLDAIWGLFNRPSFGASSHLLLEPLSGRCQQIVPWAKKAWTQGAFNSVSDSIEITCCRTAQSRAWWLSTAIFKREILASIMVDDLRRRGAPPRFVDPVGCDVQRAGWTDHNALECGNTHHDVQPNFPYDVLQAQIVRRYNAGQDEPLPGPRPKPAWWWQWCNWHLGGREGPRPDDGPLTIPSWGWQACAQWGEQH